MKTIEEKAKRYDEAIWKLRGMMPNWEHLSYNGKTFLQDLVYIFPELTESEDERVRKELIDIVAKSPITFAFEDKGKILAWLEAQGEQKDVCINIKDNQELPNKEETEVSDEYQQGYRNGFKCGKEYVEKYPQEFNLQPMQLIQECEHENLIKERLINAVNICYTEDGGKEAPFKEELIAYINKHCEWSKKDEEIIQNIINLLEEPNTIEESSYADIAIYWLKLLKDSVLTQNRWKPSDEQMEAVRLAAEIGTANNSWAMNILKSMYQDLQKLREE